jgi:hypothetical protein
LLGDPGTAAGAGGTTSTLPAAGFELTAEGAEGVEGVGVFGVVASGVAETRDGVRGVAMLTGVIGEELKGLVELFATEAAVVAATGVVTLAGVLREGWLLVVGVVAGAAPPTAELNTLPTTLAATAAAASATGKEDAEVDPAQRTFLISLQPSIHKLPHWLLHNKSSKLNSPTEAKTALAAPGFNTPLSKLTDLAAC